MYLVNFCIMPEPAHPIGTLNELDREGLARTEEFIKMGSSYALQQATQGPQSLKGLHLGN
jgi:hypothetical protein